MNNTWQADSNMHTHNTQPRAVSRSVRQAVSKQTQIRCGDDAVCSAQRAIDCEKVLRTCVQHAGSRQQQITHKHAHHSKQTQRRATQRNKTHRTPKQTPKTKHSKANKKITKRSRAKQSRAQQKQAKRTKAKQTRQHTANHSNNRAHKWEAGRQLQQRNTGL